MADGKELYVGIPTHDGRAIINSMFEIVAVGLRLERRVRVWIGEAGNIPRARNTVLDQARQYASESPAWILWIDSDIIIPPGGHHAIAEAIQWSESSGTGWVANYKMSDGQNVLMKERRLYGSPHYSQQEIEQLPDWAEIGMSGLGLAFLPVALDYEFHADRAGEDTHYFLDYSDLQVRFAKKIKIHHRKMVVL